MPIPTTTTPITSCEIPTLSAIATAPSTVKCPPKNNKIIPIPTNPKALGYVSILNRDKNNSPSTFDMDFTSVTLCFFTLLIV